MLRQAIEMSRIPAVILQHFVGLSEYERKLAIDKASSELGMSVEDIESTIHPHPTLTEALFEAAQASLDRSVHTFRKKTS